MSESDVFAVLIVSHLVGDFVLQTDWQAAHKRGGLGGDPLARRALLSHVATYTAAFIPALVWLATDIGVWTVAIAALIALPHLVQDDGQVIALWARRVKGVELEEGTPLAMALDQSFHVLALFLVALLAS